MAIAAIHLCPTEAIAGKIPQASLVEFSQIVWSRRGRPESATGRVRLQSPLWRALASVMVAWLLVVSGPARDAQAAAGATAVPSIGALAQQRLVDRTSPRAEDPARRSSELQIEAARVWLSIYRGGTPRPDGRSKTPRRTPRKGAWVEGRVEYRLSRPARAGETLLLLNFAESMPREPTELVETALETYIDGPFDPGALTIHRSDGARNLLRQGERRDVLVEPELGATTITLHYTVDVPKRYWPFGCVKKRCSLSGALAPLPSVAARGGRYLPRGGRVVAPVRWTVASAVLVGDRTRRPGAKPTAKPLRRPYEVIVVGGDGTLSQYPSVFWGPQWYRVQQIHRGVTVQVRHMRPRPSAQVPDERFVQLRRDLPGTTLKIATEVVELLSQLGQPLRPDSRITFVHGPLRSQLAEFHPDVVVLSDQALEIFPGERFIKFHRMAIARATLDMLMQRAYRGTHDPSTDTWLPGTVAFALASLWRRARDQRDEFAADILRNLTFVPAVDRFLYTQQAAFSQSYFRGVEDAPPLRNHPLWYSHALPTGRRIHEKLADTIGPKALDDFYRRVTVNRKAAPIPAAERAWGRTLDWFFDQWLGPYPSVDYLLHKVDSRRDGKGGWHNAITVQRVAQQPVIEPVQIYVEEKNRTQHHLVWNGEVAHDSDTLSDEPAGGTHTWQLDTKSKIRSVRLDPRARLLQVAQAPADNVDPRFNDRQPPQFRFLYTGAGFSLAASEFINANTVTARFNALSGFATFEGSLRRDLRVTGHAQLFRDRETVVGGGFGANAWFGAKVNNQRRRARVRTAVSTALLNPSSLDPRGGVRIIERVALIDDTRRFGWWPERGRAVAVAVSARQTVRVGSDASSDASGASDDRFDLVAGASWVHLWPVVHDHVIATSLSTDVLIPLQGDPEFRGLLRAGGIGGLSGYAADEIFGRALTLARVEYRHVYVRDLNVNFAHLGYLRAIAGTASTGLASISSCDSLKGWFDKDSYYAHVGYALGAYMSILGVTPQLIKIDLSVPLVRRQNVQCLGRVLPDYLAEVQGLPDAAPLLPPFNVNLSFGQSF